MREYLRSKLVRVGLALLIVGAAPLVLIIAAAVVGLCPTRIPMPSALDCCSSSPSGRR
jgi:hypothetical protein